MNPALWWLDMDSWMRNEETCKELTEFVHEALDKGLKPVWINNHVIELDGLRLWGRNYPYAFGNLEDVTFGPLPSRYACARLYDALESRPKPRPETYEQRAMRKTKELLQEHKERNVSEV